MSVGICSYLSRYHIGSITKSAINSLLYGRILLLVIKLVIVFFLFNIVSGLLTPDVGHKIAHFISPSNQTTAFAIYGIIMILHNKLPELATVTVIIFAIAILIPFVSIFAASQLKKRRIRKNLSKQRKTEFNVSDIQKENELVTLGMGYRIGHPEKLIKLNLSNQNRTGHTFCFGSTRIGKTRLIESMIEQDIEQGNSVVLFDPKGDIDILEKIVQVAMENNRIEDLFFINPIYPAISNKIDPLSHYYMPEEIVSHVVSGIKAKEEFFINVAYETTLAIVMSLIEKDKEQKRKLIEKGMLKPEDEEHTKLNFDDIRKRITLENLKGLADELTDNKSQRAKETLVTLQQIIKSPQDYFAKVSSSLRTVLTALSTGSTGDIIGTIHANKFIERLNQGKKVILVAQTGSMLTRKTASTISRVLISMLQSFIGRLYASGKTLDNPLAIYMDEASNLMYLGIEDMFSKAGGANIMIHAFTQSISDLEAEVGKPFARKILDNTNTKIFMRVNDPDTAKYVSNYSGNEKRYSSILSLGGGITVREVEEPLVVPDELTTLQKREFYLFTYEGKYKGFTLNSTPLKYHINLPKIGTTKNIIRQTTDKLKNSINLNTLSRFWTEDDKHSARKWTTSYNVIVKDIKLKIKKQKRYFIAAVLILIPVLIPSLILFKVLKSADLLSFAANFSIEHNYTTIMSILSLLGIFFILKMLSYTNKIKYFLLIKIILSPIRFIEKIKERIKAKMSINFYKRVKKQINIRIPIFLKQMEKESDLVQLENMEIESGKSIENQPAEQTELTSNAIDEPKKQDIIDKALNNIDITNHDYSDKYIKNFYDKYIQPIENYINPEQKTAIACILGLLNQYGQCSSVVSKDFDGNINNVATTFDILRRVSLSQHVCDTANNIVQIYHKLNFVEGSDIQDTTKAMLYIIALGHDLGKMPFLHEHKTDFTQSNPAHPALSMAVISKLITDKDMFNIKNRAILNHHNRKNPKEPDDAVITALKMADKKAREGELEEYKDLHPEKTKEINAAIKQFHDKKEDQTLSEDARSSELIIEWIDIKKDIETILNEIKRSININTGSKNQVRALYIGTEYVYVMSTLISDIVIKLAKERHKTDFIERNKSVSRRNGIALTIKNHLAAKQYLSEEISSTEFNHKYYLYNNKGDKLAEGYYIPIKTIALNITNKDENKLMKLKEKATRIIKNTYKIKF